MSYYKYYFLHTMALHVLYFILFSYIAFSKLVKRLFILKFWGMDSRRFLIFLILYFCYCFLENAFSLNLFRLIYLLYVWYVNALEYLFSHEHINTYVSVPMSNCQSICSYVCACNLTCDETVKGMRQLP